MCSERDLMSGASRTRGATGVRIPVVSDAALKTCRFVCTLPPSAIMPSKNSKTAPRLDFVLCATMDDFESAPAAPGKAPHN